MPTSPLCIGSVMDSYLIDPSSIKRQDHISMAQIIPISAQPTIIDLLTLTLQLSIKDAYQGDRVTGAMGVTG